MAFNGEASSSIDVLVFLQPDSWIAFYEIQVYLVTQKLSYVLYSISSGSLSQNYSDLMG